MNVQAVSIPVATSAPGGATNAYIVSKDDSFLVDPAEESEALMRHLKRNEIDHIVVTHTHTDHVGGVSKYRDETDACVWAHESFLDRFVEATGVEPDATFKEGTSVGGARVIHTPGHAPDHVVFRFGNLGITGDMAFADSSVFIGGSDGDMRAYLTSLRRLLHGRFERLYPGHGSAIQDPTATISRLIQHRLMREQNIVEAVRSGASDVEDIVSVAYDKDVSAVQSLAESTVRAHLEKLRVENKVAWDGSIARPITSDQGRR